VDECAICTKGIAPEDARRSVSTPQGRKPTHASCYQKYLDMDAGAVVPVRDPHATFVNHIVTEEEEMADSKAVAKWDEVLANMADQYAQGERVGGDFISLRNGVLSFQEEPMPGNQMLVVILDSVVERTFYAEKYDSAREHNAPPVCYAFGRAGEGEELAPHPSMQADLSYFKPQNDICATCPNNEWGSADTGRGKACGERRRFALLPAGYFAARRGSRDFDMHIIEEEEHFAKADIAYLKIPVTSVKEWARYVNTLASSLRRPPMAVITRVYLEPSKNQFAVKFEMVQELPPEFFDTIMARHEEATKNIIFGYNPPGRDSEDEEEGSTPRRSVRR
jgi:hypothetical protein